MRIEEGERTSEFLGREPVAQGLVRIEEVAPGAEGKEPVAQGLVRIEEVAPGAEGKEQVALGVVGEDEVTAALVGGGAA